MGIYLLLVFSISILPKAYFHDLFADHKDVPACNLTHKSSAVHKQSYDCHFDDLVVSSPFLSVDGVYDITLPDYFLSAQTVSRFLHFSSFTTVHTNRGPPVI